MAEAALAPEFDYQNPDYTAVFAERARRLQRLRSDPKMLKAVKIHYRDQPWDLITDWGMTFDPRKLDQGETPHMPFILMPKQREYAQWISRMWAAKARAQVEKSRDCGVTYTTCGWAVVMWLTVPGFVAGFGSRDKDHVDTPDDPKSIFFMLRYFIQRLPVELLPAGFDPRIHLLKNRCINPENGSMLVGEGGDEIGRGGRTSIYFVDEAAFVAHQDKVDAALSATTNCQIDISTFNGSGNAFFKKNQKLKGTDKLFVFDWRDDPRKNQAWYDKQVADFDEIIVAQEIDRNPFASNTDAFIPAKWVKASIDAHKVLGFAPEGIRVTSFDPADTGDAKAVINRWGSIILECTAFKDGDITYAIPMATSMADKFRADQFVYDADGMGGSAMKLAIVAGLAGRSKLLPYNGSAAVVDPDEVYTKTGDPNDEGRTNHETFKNYRAQTWTWMYERFRNTFQAIEKAKAGQILQFDVEKMISISTDCKDWQLLQSELSSPRRVWSDNGKIMVEPKPRMRSRGVVSPNCADALAMALSCKIILFTPPPKKQKARRLKDRGTGY